MIFDKNEYRLRELRKSFGKELDPEKQQRIRKRIAATEKRGVEYWVKFSDSYGEIQVEKVPAEYRGKRGAEKYEALKVGSVESGSFTPKASREAKVEEICDHYLNGKMHGKSG